MKKTEVFYLSEIFYGFLSMSKIFRFSSTVRNFIPEAIKNMKILEVIKFPKKLGGNLR